MIKPLKPRRAVLAVVLVAAVSAARDVSAQSGIRARRPRVPVTIAFVDTLHAGAGDYVILRGGDGGRDVILLRPSADAATFSDAVRSVMLIRTVRGEPGGNPHLVRTRGAAGGNRPSRPLPWATRVLDDLRKSTPREVASLGMVPAMEIWLPAQQHGGAAPAITRP
ncbi:MAG TPA: hypothetical protein VGB15_20045 [Longimicrobium sp.]|jgi:hypothetical protein